MIIDLRSDTVTKPTPGMLDAMLNAKIGDDVFGEDEAINQLEEETAALFGMEAGLFCPSGTMTNQIAINVLSNAPGEVICDQLSHVYQYEGGGISFNSGLSVNLLNGPRGILTPQMIIDAINPTDVHKAESQLVCIENTCNRGGGSIYAMETIKDISQACKQHHLNLHLDGARVFNAIVAGNQQVHEYGTYFDSISICLSKGLGAPVGSVLVGKKHTINKARRVRKIFGGGMRQAGYLAAAGSYALNNHIEKLKDDHLLAKEIEQLLIGKSYVEEVMPVDTNIIVFKLTPQHTTTNFLERLNEQNIKAVAFGPQMIRFVTHLDVNTEMLNQLEVALRGIESNS